MRAPPPETTRALFEALKPRCREISRRWLERLEQIRPVAANRVFPTGSLLDHIPQILERLLDAVVTGEDASNDDFIQRDVERLADLRRRQGYALDEVLAEFDLLRSALFEAVRDEVAKRPRLETPALLEGFHAFESGLHVLVLYTARHYHEADRSQRMDRARLLELFGRAVTHELRNRVNAATLGLDVLRALEGAGEEEPRREQAARLEASIRRIEGVVEDLHAITVAHARPEPVEGRFQDLSELVAQVFEDLQPLARSHDVRLTTPGDLPDMPLDATRVQLILVNLVGNGIKFADAEKSERFVRVRVRREGEGTCTIQVEDNGIGIPTERRSAIFDRGVRLDTHLEDGEGLGLALAAEAARQLGGRIRVESEPGRGSTFSFEVREPPTDLAPLPSRDGAPEA